MRFWSTVTHGMNIGQTPDSELLSSETVATSLHIPSPVTEMDMAIVQTTDGQRQRVFHYAPYPFQQWYRQTMDFEFVDVLLVPHKRLALFEVVLVERGNACFCRTLSSTRSAAFTVTVDSGYAQSRTHGGQPFSSLLVHLLPTPSSTATFHRRHTCSCTSICYRTFSI